MTKDKLEVVVAYHRPCSGTSPAKTEKWTQKRLVKITNEEVKIRTRYLPNITNKQAGKQAEMNRDRNLNKGIIKEKGIHEVNVL